MALDRSAFLKPAKPAQESVNIPQLGGDVIIRGLTASERSRFETQFNGPSGKPIKSRQMEFRERLIIATAVDETTGAPLFTVADIEMLGNHPAETLEPLVDAAQRLCGMSGRDVEDLAKNCEGGSETS